MSSTQVEIIFLKPTFVPQALPNGLGVAVRAEAPRPLQLSAVNLIRKPTAN